jgi:hypothetical protein
MSRHPSETITQPQVRGVRMVVRPPLRLQRPNGATPCPSSRARADVAGRYLDGERVGWCAVEPRTYYRLRAEW